MSSVVQTRETTSTSSGMPRLRVREPTTGPSSKSETDVVPEDIDLPDNYVAWTLKNQKELPPITWSNIFQNIEWVSLAALTLTPAIAIWGLFNVRLRTATFVWSVIYYFITGLGVFSLSISFTDAS